MLAAAALSVAPSVWAAKASSLNVTLDVKPADAPPAQPALQTYSVSVSRAGLDSYASYRVKFTNDGGNTINQVVFTATTTVEGSSHLAPYSAFVNVDTVSPNCPMPTATPAASVTCNIGQLSAGASREFFLIFKAPTSGAAIKFNGNTDFSEGNSSGAPPASFTANVDNTMALITISEQQVSKSVKTVLPPSGGDFFTGPNGQATAASLFSTSVHVPATPVVTDNAIDQSNLPSYACSSANPGYFCYGLSSDIDILDAKSGDKVILNVVAPGKVVTILLRQDAQSLAVKKPTPSVNAVKIFYSATGGVGPEVLACTPAGPAPDVPCVNARRNFLKGKKGYYEFEILARDNGRFSW